MLAIAVWALVNTNGATFVRSKTAPVVPSFTTSHTSLFASIYVMHDYTNNAFALGSFIHHSFLLTKSWLTNKNLQIKCELSN
jgi:uncharacterized protein YabN with tetrapyrrole methylase and pyrophosphatase domain